MPSPPEQEVVTLWRCPQHGFFDRTMFDVAGEEEPFLQCPVPTYQSEPCGAELLPFARVVPASLFEAVEAERDAAHHALRQCIRLTGVDLSDGFPTWPPLHEFAVREVLRLREEADDE